MSEAQRAMATVGGSEAVKAVEHQPAPEHPLPPHPGRFGPVALMGLGGLLAGVIASTALLALPGGQGSDFEIKTVAKDQIEAALVSMGDQASPAIAEDAKRCKAPLAVLTVSAREAGTIRIRSGSYLSPLIQLTSAAQRVAVPFPAPFPAGKGVFSVEGAGKGVNIWLSPGQHYDTLSGAAPINVWWSTKNPC